jgi:hypothetical protein
LAGGRGAGSPKIEPNCAAAGWESSSAAIPSNAIERMGRAIKFRLFAWPAWIRLTPLEPG